MTTEAYVGQRRCYDSHLCTVRYIGSIKGTQGEWLGVEWDDLSRGKHAGEHAGVKYFSSGQSPVFKIKTRAKLTTPRIDTSRQANAASFVRPSRRPDVPRDFVEAVKHKYASDFGAHGVYSVQGFQQADANIRISGKDVEEVGFDKIRRQLANLRQLRILLVDTLRVHRLAARGDDAANTSGTDVYDTCPNVCELDLSRNLFERWAEVLDICRQLPQLTSLRADGNRFASVAHRLPQDTLHAAPFTSVKTLGLDETMLSWTDVGRICGSMPGLATLSACGNEYESLPQVSMPSGLTSINLERNDFVSFQSITSLASISSLQKLSLKSNSIRACCEDSVKDTTSGSIAFPPALTDLDIAYNQVQDWGLIDQLVSVFPGLTTLRVSHNPLYDTLDGPDGKRLTPEDGYMLTLARIGRLERLNYTEINTKTRLNAELFYLSLIARQLSHLPPSTDPAPTLAQHARYADLRAKYPDTSTSTSTSNLSASANPQPSNQIDPNSLAASLITLSITLDPSVAAQTPASKGPTWTRRVPRSCTIYTLQGLVGKQFGLRPMQLRLVWETGEETVVTASFENDYDDDDDNGSDSDSNSSNTNENDDKNDKTIDSARSKRKTPPPPPAKKTREEILTPRVRSLGTWADDLRSADGAGSHGGGIAGATAMTLRVEWDELCVRRAGAARAEVGRSWGAGARS